MQFPLRGAASAGHGCSLTNSGFASLRLLRKKLPKLCYLSTLESARGVPYQHMLAVIVGVARSLPFRLQGKKRQVHTVDGRTLEVAGPAYEGRVSGEASVRNRTSKAKALHWTNTPQVLTAAASVESRSSAECSRCPPWGLPAAERVRRLLVRVCTRRFRDSHLAMWTYASEPG